MTPQPQNNNRKKEKDLRKKNYADLLIQGTNNSSIASKRSVEHLYMPKLAELGVGNTDGIEWFKFFVKKAQRRSPVINRGYWVRMESITRSIEKIVTNPYYQDYNISIISLGCGYDPLAYKILSTSAKGVRFFDFDYPDLIRNKVEMIRGAPEICHVIGTEESCDIEGVQLKTATYAAIGCNLRDEILFNKQLTSLGLNQPKTVKIFIAEVSLAYMNPEHANEIIRNTSTYENSHFIILEQLTPSGAGHPFANTMLYHFGRLEHPLKCVIDYPGIPEEIERFEKYFPFVEARDLLGHWELAESETKKAIESIEGFDEWEEFYMYTQHYIVLHGTNNSQVSIYPERTRLEETISEELNDVFISNVAIESGSTLERKFAAGCVIGGQILINGGMMYNRVNSTISISSKESQELRFKEHKLPARMCHTLNTLTPQSAILIGGRTGPQNPLSSVYKLQSDEGIFEWIPLNELSEPRSRHVTVNYKNTLLVFGGLSKNSGAAPFTLYQPIEDQWLSLESSLANRRAAAFCWNDDVGYVIGGMDNSDEIDDSIYKISVENDRAVSTKLFSHSLLKRYGAKASFVGENKILLVGGVSDNQVLNSRTSVILVDLVENKIHAINVGEEIWKQFPMLVGFELIDINETRKVCVGGGAVCFGFGSSWNHLLVIDINGEEGEVSFHVKNETIEV